jgi:hypothetical protein
MRSTNAHEVHRNLGINVKEPSRIFTVHTLDYKPVGALDAHAAARYLGMKDGRCMDSLPIPRVDLAKPGASRPRWVWRVEDLDAFLSSRVVQPGHYSPWSSRRAG